MHFSLAPKCDMLAVINETIYQTGKKTEGEKFFKKSFLLKKLSLKS